MFVKCCSLQLIDLHCPVIGCIDIWCVCGENVLLVMQQCSCMSMGGFYNFIKTFHAQICQKDVLLCGTVEIYKRQHGSKFFNEINMKICTYMLSELTAHSAFSHLQITQNAFILICFEIYILDLFIFFTKYNK